MSFYVAQINFLTIQICRNVAVVNSWRTFRLVNRDILLKDCRKCTLFYAFRSYLRLWITTFTSVLNLLTLSFIYINVGPEEIALLSFAEIETFIVHLDL